MAIVAVVMIAGFSAFKIADNAINSQQPVWYEVGERTDGSGVLEVKSIMSSTPQEGTDPDGCATDNPGEICAIKLALQPTAPNPIGYDVDDIPGLPGVSEEDRAFSPHN